jgi:hypothetical protein
MSKLTMESVVTRQDGNLMGGEMGNETVMMDMTSGDYLGLNEVGTSIWKMIAQPTKVSDICAQLMNEYKVDSSTCKMATLTYLEDLRKENMLVVK